MADQTIEPNELMLLALETSTNVCSVAFCNKEGAVFEKRTEKRGSHSEQLFLFIEDLMQEHSFKIEDLDAVLISQGPGSYTGLRIAASAVKGLLFSSSVPLYGVHTLAAFAMQAMAQNPKSGTIHAIMDARRVHLYHRKFKVADNRLKSKDEVKVIPIKTFEEMFNEGDIIVGTGGGRLSDNLQAKADIYDQKLISAISLIQVFKQGFADFYEDIDPESFEPKYYTSNQV